MLTPPTDTLPKFCAVAGLLAIVSASAWHLHVRRELEDLVIAQAVPNLQMQRLSDSITDLEASVEEALKALEASSTPDQGTLKAIREKFDETAQLRAAADEIIVESESRMVAARLAGRRAWESLVVLAIALAGGGIASYWGFTKWAAAEKRKKRAAAA